MLVQEFLEASARLHPGKVALICGDERPTYAEIDRRCNQFAHALRAGGFERGDRAIIYLDNSVETVVSIFAVLKAGGVFVVVNPTTKADKLVFLLNNCRATAMVAPAAKLAALREHANDLPHLKTVWTVGGPAGDFGSKIAVRCLAEASSHPDAAPPAPRIDIDLAALIYTSGSTGMPKGVMLTHLNIISAATSITTYLELQSDEIILNLLPLAFDYGLYQVLMAFKVGATVILHRTFSYPFTIIETMMKEKVTGLPIVPTTSAVLLQMDLKKYEFPHLRYITNTAANLPVEHIQRMRQLFPQVRIYSMYGLTECKRVSYLPPEQIDIRPGSVGRGMPNEEVYIVDDEGQRVGPGVIGELVVRGSNVMKGYWELPEETGKRLRPGPLPGERVLYTGDLFRADEEGYLFFVARKDDIIKSRGEKVAPKEVENVLYSHPSVAEAAVIGIPDPMLGQAIKAYVTLKTGETATAREIQGHCARHLEDFMVPKTIEICEALPKTTTGKISKLALTAGAGHDASS